MSLQGLGKVVSLAREVTGQFAAHALRTFGQTPVVQSWVRELVEADWVWEQG